MFKNLRFILTYVKEVYLLLSVIYVTPENCT